MQKLRSNLQAVPKVCYKILSQKKNINRLKFIWDDVYGIDIVSDVSNETYRLVSICVSVCVNIYQAFQTPCNDYYLSNSIIFKLLHILYYTKIQSQQP